METGGSHGPLQLCLLTQEAALGSLKGPLVSFAFIRKISSLSFPIRGHLLVYSSKALLFLSFPRGNVALFVRVAKWGSSEGSSEYFCQSKGAGAGY